MTRVMVVDDEQSLRMVVGFVLKLNGCEVVQVPDGEECLQRVRGGFRGVILMDVMMPGLTGWQTIQTLITENLLEGILICMLTATWAPGDSAEGLEAHVFDYLPKPFDNKALIGCVDNAARFLRV
jgi:CheY-like chemotaxis protein